MAIKRRDSSAKKREKRAVYFLLLLLFSIFFLAWPLGRVFNAGKRLAFTVKYFKDGVILQNLPQMQNALLQMGATAKEMRTAANFLVWLKIVPLLNGYYSDLVNLSEAAEKGAVLGQEILQVIEPVGENIGLSSTGERKPLGGQERLAGLATVTPLLAENYESFAPQLQEINQRTEKINPNRYPERVGGQTLRPLLAGLKEAVAYLAENREDVRNLLLIVPELLGVDGGKNYLVLFQNDKELRPTGGFWTAYALFRLEKGRIVSIQAGDIYFLDIDNRVAYYPPAPEVINKYLKLDKWYIRDTNLSPDYRQAVETFNEFWARVPGVPEVDGVLAIDTSFVQGMLELLGEIKIPNYETFTSENVVYQLELIANILGSREEKRGGRKDIIGVLMREMLNKAFALPANKYDKLIAAVLTLAQRKHLLFYFRDSVTQDLVEKYNFAGRIVNFPGDYLLVNDANFAGRKGNLYVKEAVSKEVKLLGGGKEVVSTLTIDYENTGAYNADLNTGYRDYVRVYVPEGAELLDDNGSLEPVVAGQELGKTYFAAYMAVDPLKKARLTLTYRLPVSILEGKTYRLLIQKQPGTDGQIYTVKVGGRKEEFELDTDRLIEVTL
jgi:hypothetical protein